MKKILVISSSPRKHGNTERLVQEFCKGVTETGNTVDVISLEGKALSFCKGCLVCMDSLKCVIQDDVCEILQKMQAADALVFATPVYYYSVSGQLKVLFDRTSPLYNAKNSFRDVYLLAAAAADDKTTFEGTEKAVQGWIDCFENVHFAGRVYAGNVYNVGDIDGHPALREAYKLGRSI